jgi:predicted 3-demethylubiquinone-9 3-methyltransferase (glyoxalase superfamily)
MSSHFSLALPIAKGTKVTFSSGKTFFVTSGSQKETESTFNTFRSQLEQPSFGNAED